MRSRGICQGHAPGDLVFYGDLVSLQEVYSILGWVRFPPNHVHPDPMNVIAGK